MRIISTSIIFSLFLMFPAFVFADHLPSLMLVPHDTSECLEDFNVECPKEIAKCTKYPDLKQDIELYGQVFEGSPPSACHSFTVDEGYLNPKNDGMDQCKKSLLPIEWLTKKGGTLLKIVTLGVLKVFEKAEDLLDKYGIVATQEYDTNCIAEYLARWEVLRAVFERCHKFIYSQSDDIVPEYKFKNLSANGKKKYKAAGYTHKLTEEEACKEVFVQAQKTSCRCILAKLTGIPDFGQTFSAPDPTICCTQCNTQKVEFLSADTDCTAILKKPISCKCDALQTGYGFMAIDSGEACCKKCETTLQAKSQPLPKSIFYNGLNFKCAAGQITIPDIKDFPNPLKSGITNPQTFIANLIKTFLGIIGSLALALVVWGGVVWMTAAGDSERLKSGQKTVVWALIGIAAIFVSSVVVKFVITAIG